MKRGFFLSMILVFALLAAACGGGKSAGTATELRVGTDAQYPPFEKQEGNGEITGFDIEIISAVAKAEGMKVSVKHTGWDPLFEAVKRGKIDAGISAMTITEDRLKSYDFSDPYFEAKQLLLVPVNSKVKTLKDLKGKQIGVQSGTTGEEVTKKAFGKTYSGIRGYDDTPAAIEDLVNGRVDGVVADNGVVRFFMKQLDDRKFKVIEDPSFEAEHYGIVVKKGNTELLDKINSGLKKIKEDGTYDQIHSKYFGK
ncbi:basic amino acid ABC transporter substrate-binding protein [Kroppenstedtia eburnea]|uniref:basic amino acid ABC transporter substrate-binding protein n=1 Tax=Kroppenstedtia eburnea TaxID=714067 RepID=UPI0002D8796B|nr:basic amino acid ABC transporter substrate-binding protein [Kroppenstedtia eburnea]